ncbi:prolyl oligopeptidase family serine peptidase [Aeoliella sp. SH292]|uniref:prolyl oligopeptidase family serine peptidase n=1 Tax=Aeoliella sp. SH292 TaxID=3454464 RepID=UPI003F951B70
MPTLKLPTLLTILSLFLSTAAMAAEPPETPKRPVSDTYHGTKVTEDYRWLEDWESGEVKAWSEAQNEYARSILDKLPGTEELREQVTAIMSAQTARYGGVKYAGGNWFAMKNQPPLQQSFLVVADSPTHADKIRVLVDPNEIDKTGATTIEWFRPSPDGKLVAVCMSMGGHEVGDVRVYETATGKQLADEVPRVNTGTAGGDLSWDPKGEGFYYTRHPRAGERADEDMNFYQQVYYHQLGTATEDDRYEIGKDFPRIAETRIDCDKATGRVLATVQYGDGGQFSHFLRDTDGTWHEFSKFEDRVIQAEFGQHDDLYIISRADAPRGKLLHVKISDLKAGKFNTILPESDDTLVTTFWEGGSLLATADRIFVVYQLGGPTEIRVFDLQGKPLEAPAQPEVASAGELANGPDGTILFTAGSYIQPSATYLFHPKSGVTTATDFRYELPVSLADAEVRREFATSKDGTKVPVNLIFPKGTKLDGKNPCLITAYGGYGVSLEPGASSLNRILLDHGFVVGVANIRGGGEYGESWHLEGNLTKKQNVFDDFAAVLEHVIERGYTSSDRLAIEGGSNGGLLMGATLTQHPNLMKCVISHVGIYDMLRVELSPNGAFNITEFGTVENPEQFEALYNYSPIHQVKDGTKYPPVLFLTGANDPRVDPMQSRKMTARLQAAGDSPILLRTSSDSGHGAGTPLSERIEQEVDCLAFMFDELGVKVETKKD